MIGMAWAIPAEAQRVVEIGVHGLVTTADPWLATAGGYAAIRTSRRVRVAVTAGAGVANDDLVARGELLGHFMLNPTALRKAGVYAGGGIAGVLGPADEGYLVLLLGVESCPGAASGWAVEIGLGGGVRILGGYRWRRQPRSRQRRCRKRNRPGFAAPGRCDNIRRTGIRPRRNRR